MQAILKQLTKIACLVGLGYTMTASVPAATFQTAHVEVSYEGISDAYGHAIGKTVAAARAIAADQFGFDMPETLFVSVKAGQGQSMRLHNDGQDHIFLTVTGTFHLYGLCHEIGHLAMYRVIRQRPWLSHAGAEGWAHYAGSQLLDAVYAREGEQLWPDTYNYLEDGTARLRKQLAAAKVETTTLAAGLWLALAEIVGDKGLAPLFVGWGNLSVDETRPGIALGKALLASGDSAKLESWWEKARPVLIVARAQSDFARQGMQADQLKTPSRELAQDDGVSAGKRSVAGSGHAVRFDAPGKNVYLTAVRLFGSRYGQVSPPRENALVWLCDSGFKKIAEFPVPYASFARGAPKWVTIPVKPTRVPPQFVICVGFNPTATKGVFVHHDRAGSGDSFFALPGRTGRSFDKGDWLIRAVVQEAKE